MNFWIIVSSIKPLRQCYPGSSSLSKNGSSHGSLWIVFEYLECETCGQLGFCDLIYWQYKHILDAWRKKTEMKSKKLRKLFLSLNQAQIPCVSLRCWKFSGQAGTNKLVSILVITIILIILIIMIAIIARIEDDDVSDSNVQGGLLCHQVCLCRSWRSSPCWNACSGRSLLIYWN